jgi:putative hemolysin
MRQLLTTIKTNYRFRSHGIHRFGPKFVFKFEAGPYVVKTADQKHELIDCFRLRNEVFNREFRGVKNLEYDFDEFDSICDHIVILHKESNKIVGTYRLNSSLFSKKFYTLSEFDIKHFRSLPGPVLELGRACIQKEHRRGIVISLLWRGIAEYMKISNSRTLIGCSSIKICDSRGAALVYQYLSDKGHLDSRYCAKPKPKYEMDHFAVWHEYLRDHYSERLETEAESLIPPLLRSYLKLGAKIFAEPAYDQDFNCIDLLTVLERDQLMKTAGKKFGLEV